MTEMMHAVGYRKPAPISDPASLEDAEVPVPEPGPRDLLVQVKAVSVSPVDVKLRASADPGGEVKILGYDAAGVVTAAGGSVTLFAPGDELYYAGSVARPGTDAQFHLVDERIVGHKPRTLSFPEAAALPLTTIVAWETLFDRFRLSPGDRGHAAGPGRHGRCRVNGHPAGAGPEQGDGDRHCRHAGVTPVGVRPRGPTRWWTTATWWPRCARSSRTA